MIKRVRPGKVIMKKGSKKGDLLILLILGNLVTATGEVYCEKLSFAEESNIYNYESSGYHESNISLDSKGLISYIRKGELTRIIGGQLAKVLMKMREQKQETKDLVDDCNEVLQFTDLETHKLLKKLGDGQFGDVFLSSDENKKLFAVKRI